MVLAVAAAPRDAAAAVDVAAAVAATVPGRAAVVIVSPRILPRRVRLHGSRIVTGPGTSGPLVASRDVRSLAIPGVSLQPRPRAKTASLPGSPGVMPPSPGVLNLDESGVLVLTGGVPVVRMIRPADPARLPIRRIAPLLRRTTMGPAGTIAPRLTRLPRAQLPRLTPRQRQRRRPMRRRQKLRRASPPNRSRQPSDRRRAQSRSSRNSLLSPRVLRLHATVPPQRLLPAVPVVRATATRPRIDHLSSLGLSTGSTDTPED